MAEEKNIDEEILENDDISVQEDSGIDERFYGIARKKYEGTPLLVIAGRRTLENQRFLIVLCSVVLQ